MKVTCITPTTSDRAAYNERVKVIFESQDYLDKEHIILSSAGTVGAKRNQCISMGGGEIILHLDSDDIYAPDWISNSVVALVESRADMTGLRNAYFYAEDGRLWEYHNTGGQPYTIGAAMCYWRYAWERQPFREISEGEDMYFCVGKRIYNHRYKEGFAAIIHGKNTCSHKALGIKEMRALPLRSAPSFLDKYYTIPRPASPAPAPQPYRRR